MGEKQENNQDSIKTNLEALNITKSLAERADKGRKFLSTNGLDINKIAKDLSVTATGNPADDGKFVDLVVKVQAKLGFKNVDSGSGQDGIFGRKTFEAYKDSLERSNKDQARLVDNGRKLAGPSQAEIDSINEDQLALARLEEELNAPGSTPTERPLTAPAVAPQLAEPVRNPEMARLKAGLENPSQICVIGDSNATRMAARIPGAQTIGAEGQSSARILEMVSDEPEKLQGVKLVLLRVGGNDRSQGNNLTTEQTMENIAEIIKICKRAGVPEIRILTRQPLIAKMRGGDRSKAALAQRQATLDKYGDGKAVEEDGTRVAVIDIYREMAGDKPVDKNLSLPKSLAGTDSLHMNRKGYAKTLQIISQATGAPQIAKWSTSS